MPLTPKNRKEEWLQGLVDHETTLTPKNRPEEWMKEIIDASGSGGGGGTGGVLVVYEDPVTHTLDKTWQEIHDADMVVIQFSEDGRDFRWYPLVIYEEDGAYYIDCISYTMLNIITRTYSAETVNDYPFYE